MNRQITLVMCAALLGVSVAGMAAEKETAPTGRGIGTINHPPQADNASNQGKTAGGSKGGPRTGTNGISYHGGPLMTSGINVYYIWYGNWAGNTATSILPAVATGIGGTPYFNTNTTYTDGSGKPVLNGTGSVTLAGQVSNSYSLGVNLTDDNIANIVSSAIQNGLGGGKPDPNGIYFVLTSKDVKATSGFCTQYCGWHTHMILNSTDVKYSFVGNGEQCPSACMAQTLSPNGNAGADAMASTIVHELEEAATDPDLNAWFDTKGYENADKCAWNFGTTYLTANGAKANVKFGGLDFLIQQNWVNANGGYCALSY